MSSIIVSSCLVLSTAVHSTTAETAVTSFAVPARPSASSSRSTASRRRSACAIAASSTPIASRKLVSRGVAAVHTHIKYCVWWPVHARCSPHKMYSPSPPHPSSIHPPPTNRFWATPASLLLLCDCAASADQFQPQSAAMCTISIYLPQQRPRTHLS